jgi:hypothetical protein
MSDDDIIKMEGPRRGVRRGHRFVESSSTAKTEIVYFFNSSESS